ncbi:hypothetical protein [Modestobacter versicolor]|uniref:NifU family protein n=1 Tax=Modestobacter versicolor TaxID=429133 RepID=A0A323VHJ7_9ACTN|nr:hypothetical protein [Modestobacter versicolor]MBB3675042.1 hypothetical protein [Modestobacter versicolor]PZA23360.1 hypothetical protein DMO24_00260 [Modestobacter versicolor]
MSTVDTTGQQTPAGDDQQVDEALQGLRDVLAADGYVLGWSRQGDAELVVQVAAGEGACEDCLVPETVMHAILTDALTSTPYSVARVELPAGAK